MVLQLFYVIKQKPTTNYFFTTNHKPLTTKPNLKLNTIPIFDGIDFVIL